MPIVAIPATIAVIPEASVIFCLLSFCVAGSKDRPHPGPVHLASPVHADPSEYLKGKTFNKDVFQTESWESDDGVGTKEKRQILTGAIKKMTATSEHRIEGKFLDGIQPPPVFIRIHAYVNTDSESDLSAIPEITDSIRDKLLILHASESKHERQSTLLPDANVEGAREAFVEKIRAAMPAFLHFIQNREIPEKYRSARFGVGPYINRDLEKVLHKASDEGKLAALIDKLLFTHMKLTKAWEGTEEELENLLAVNARDTSQTQDLSNWPRRDPTATVSAHGNMEGFVGGSSNHPKGMQNT